MKLQSMTLLLLLVAVSVLLASCSSETRTLGGPAAIGGNPPKHGLLGVAFAMPDSLEINDVLPGSPAEEAQLAAGDTITAIDGQKVSKQDELRVLMEKTKPKTMVELQFQRDAETKIVKVRLMSFTEYADLKAREHKGKNAN